jgi:hypothetical protein
LAYKYNPLSPFLRGKTFPLMYHRHPELGSGSNQ